MSEEILSVDDIKKHLTKAAFAWVDLWYPYELEKREENRLRELMGVGERIAIAMLAAESIRASITSEKIMKVISTRLNMSQTRKTKQDADNL